jgi:hypothetical protein
MAVACIQRARAYSAPNRSAGVLKDAARNTSGAGMQMGVLSGQFVDSYRTFADRNAASIAASSRTDTALGMQLARAWRELHAEQRPGASGGRRGQLDRHGHQAARHQHSDRARRHSPWKSRQNVAAVSHDHRRRHGLRSGRRENDGMQGSRRPRLRAAPKGSGWLPKV